MADNGDRREPVQPERARNRARMNLEIVGIGATLIVSGTSIYQSLGKQINSLLLAVVIPVVVAVVITLIGFFAKRQ